MDKKPLFIAGPCVIESAELLDTVAATLADINRRLGVEIIFKASFDKANRTSISSFRGPGLEQGLRMLADVRAKWGLRLLTDNYLAFGTAAPEVPGPVLPDSVGVKWYNDEYVALYGRLTSAIKNYMTSTQSSLAPRAEQMKKNAYRAVTPVLISLAVMIAIVLMLYYFMSVYCVNPILRMNKGLGDYLSFRVPFVVKADCKDEMLELKEKIETLITISKQPKA
jgi:hypothetical protein